MLQAKVVPIERLEMSFAPRPWPFAEQHRSEIDAHFAARRQAIPELWNGRVLLMHEHTIDGATFRGSFLLADFASFLWWRDRGLPDTGVIDCFAQGAILAADGAFLLGVMGPHTANAGHIYFPSGTPDPSDLSGSTVDLDASVWREMAEETGLTAAELAPDPGWHTVLSGARIAHIRTMRAGEDAAAMRRRILDTLARQQKPELSDIRIVRGPADLDPMMPAFVKAFLTAVWAKAD